VDQKGYDGTGEARHQDARSGYGDQVDWPVAADQIEVSGATFVAICLKAHGNISSCATPARSCERLVAQDDKGGDRGGHLEDHGADRQQQDFVFRLLVHRALRSGRVQTAMAAKGSNWLPLDAA
jgi:hypothetical protein